MATVGAGGSRAKAARAPGPAALLAITGAAGAAVAASVTLTLSSDHVIGPAVHAALMSWITLAYVFAGVIAWWRRPESRLGPMMIVAGFAVFLSSLSSANFAFPYTIGIAFDLLPPVLLLHLFLGFPSGRLERRLDRALVAAGYAIAFGAQLVGLALGGFGEDNLIGLAAEPEAAYSLLRIQLGLLGALCVAGVAVLVVRWRGGGRPLRRSRALLVDSFGLALVMIAVLYAWAALGLLGGEPAFEVLRRVTLFAIGLAPLAFLAGLLDARLGRATVGDLLLELRAGPAPAGLRDALGRALRDPSVRLVYWLPNFGGWADADGHPVELAEAGAGRATTLIDRGGDHLAALLHDPSLEEEPELLEAVAAAAAIALENGRLQAELHARLEELKGSRARIVEAADHERRRIERDLHDGAQQRMVAIALQLRLLQGRIRGDPDEAERLLTTASDELALSLSELRELARGIHPAVLEHGLATALESLATRSAVPATVLFEPGERLPERVELAAYFVASEALANVAKYASATTVTIRVRRTATGASIEIADDGGGGADSALGSGLRGLADRVEALNGRLRVTSPVGGGTVITAELPCELSSPTTTSRSARGSPRCCAAPASRSRARPPPPTSCCTRSRPMSPTPLRVGGRLTGRHRHGRRRRDQGVRRRPRARARRPARDPVAVGRAADRCRARGLRPAASEAPAARRQRRAGDVRRGVPRARRTRIRSSTRAQRSHRRSRRRSRARATRRCTPEAPTPRTPRRRWRRSWPCSTCCSGSLSS